MALKIADFKKIYLIDKVADEDKFNHQDFAEILWKIINDNTVPEDKTPFNVGIFGKWGVGKSTIVHLFRNKLEEWNKRSDVTTKYKFIDFKVWKFSNDALKNKFIFTIGKELNEKELDKLSTEIRAKRTYLYSFINAPHYFYKELLSLKNIPWRSLVESSILFVIFLFLFLRLNSILRWNLVQSLSDWVFVLWGYLIALLPSFLTYLGKVLKETQLEVTFDKFDTEEQFEEKFIEIVKKDKSIKIIFIDDLDRCNEEKVMETLETIKTYLDVETCIFVIACDDDVVRSIVGKEREELCKRGDSFNYLNKFFQYSIRITPFFHQNMIEFAKEILRSQKNDLVKLKDLDDILYVLIHDGVKSPRKVISLLNNFASDFELIMKREGKVLQIGDVSEMLSALAVFTVLKTDFPNYYQLLIKDTNLFKYLFAIEQGQLDSFEEYQKDIIKEIYQFFDKSHPKDAPWLFVNEEAKNFVNFIKRVDDIIRDTDDINLFIYLNRDQSTSTLKSERFRTLRNFVRGGNLKEVKDMISELKGDEEKIKHFNIIMNTIKELKFKQEIKKGLQCLFHVIELIPQTENNNIKTISRVAMEKMLLVATDKTKWVEDFNLDGIFFTLLHLESLSTRKETVTLLIDALTKTTNKDFAERIFKAILKYENLIEDQATQQKLIGVLTKRKPVDENDASVKLSLLDVCQYIGQFHDKKVAILRFFSNEIAGEICERILQIDKGEEQKDEQKTELELLKKALNTIDTWLQEDGRTKMRVELFIKLLPTSNTYYEIVDKIEKMKEMLPIDSAELLVEALCKEVENTPNEDFVRITNLIEDISRQIKTKPVKGFNLLVAPFVKCISGESDIEADQAMNCTLKFADERLSLEQLDGIISALMDEIKANKNIKTTKRICDFILNNSNLISVANKNKFSTIMIREIYDVETYTKFANNEGFEYWKSIFPKAIILLDEKDKILEPLEGSILSESQKSLKLDQKSYLMDLLLANFDNYSFPSQQKFLALLLPHLQSGNKESITWGVNYIYRIIKAINEEMPEQLKEKLVISLNSALINCDGQETRYKILELLIDLRNKVLLMGGNYKDNLLTYFEQEFGIDKNHNLALKGFGELFSSYTLEKQIQILGLYLGSKAYSAENSEYLVNKTAAEFSKLPTTQNETGQEVNFAEEPKIKFTEAITVGISSDRIAWTFFAELSKKLITYLKPGELKFITTENFKKIKDEEETLGISRNRFTMINNLRNKGIYGDSEIYGMFSHLFSDESIEKVKLGLDFFNVYYAEISRVPKKDRQSYKAMITKAAERVSDDEVKMRLNKLAERF